MNYTILGVPTTFVADTRRWHSDDFEKRSPITRKTFEPKSAVDTYTYQVYRFRRPRCHPLGGYRPYRYSRHYLVAMVFVPSLFFSCFFILPSSYYYILVVFLCFHHSVSDPIAADWVGTDRIQPLPDLLCFSVIVLSFSCYFLIFLCVRCSVSGRIPTDWVGTDLIQLLSYDYGLLILSFSRSCRGIFFSCLVVLYVHHGVCDRIPTERLGTDRIQSLCY